VVWEVEYTGTFGSWWDQLTPDEQERVTAAVELPEQSGPRLDGRSWTPSKTPAIQI